MTLKELKVNCIKFTAMDEQVGFTTENYNVYSSSPEYLAYTNNILHSINKAKNRIVDLRKVAIKTAEIAHDYDTSEKKMNVKLDLSAITDIEELISVNYEITETYEIFPMYEYRVFNNNLVIENMEEEGKYLIKYFPNVADLTDEQDATDLTTLGLTPKLCAIIEYFCKATLWEKEQPELALHYRDIAESYLEDIRNYDTDSFHQGKVETTYRL